MNIFIIFNDIDIKKYYNSINNYFLYKKLFKFILIFILFETKTIII